MARPVHWLGSTPSGNLALLLGVLLFLCSIPLVLGIYGAKSPWLIALKVMQPLGICAFVMWLQLGSPLNWWRPFFGTTMHANKDKLALREQEGESPEAIQSEILAWVEGCAKGRWIKVNPYSYKFLRRGDAAFFKLAWG